MKMSEDVDAVEVNFHTYTRTWAWRQMEACAGAQLRCIIRVLAGHRRPQRRR
jgi:hypothetical protein